MEITLPSGRKIGDGYAPFIIAECGSNWATLDDCLHSISMAKATGADAVKFQAFNDDALYGANPVLCGTPGMGGSMWYELYGRKHQTVFNSTLPLDWLPKLKHEADKVGIEFMCSAFSPELVEEVDKYVNIHKVASAEMTHVRILEKLRDLKKPVIMSTGASGLQDIAMAVKTMGDIPKVLLYCVASYPANEVILENIKALRSQFGTLSGYSDHSTDVLVIPKAATSAGACVIEKHFTAQEDLDTPDRPHSLTVEQFKRMVKAIRGDVSSSIGPGREEQSMVTKHNRRLIATKDIGVGDTLREGENFGIYRSLKEDTRAMSPFSIDLVKGRTARRDIKAGDGISRADFE